MWLVLAGLVFLLTGAFLLCEEKRLAVTDLKVKIVHN